MRNFLAGNDAGNERTTTGKGDVGDFVSHATCSVIVRFTFHLLSVQLPRIGVPYPTSNWTSKLARFSRSCPLVRRLQWMGMLTRQEAVDFVLGNCRTSTELRLARKPDYT